MPAILLAILTFLGNIGSKVLLDRILGFLALKAILVLLFTVVVPIILNNWIYDMIEIMFNYANGQLTEVSSMSGSMSFGGFMAWVIEQFQLSQCLAVIVSALQLRLYLSMIPFVRL